MFTKGDLRSGGVTVTLYVDDVKIISSDRAAVDSLKKKLGERFEMSDLGPISYYLGIEVIRQRKQGLLMLSQKGYILNSLKRFGMEDCKPVDTPMASG